MDMSDSKTEETRTIEQMLRDRPTNRSLDEVSKEGVERLRELYQQELEEYDGQEVFAFTSAVSEFNFENHVASADTVRVNAIGANGPRPFGDQQALFLFGAAIPENEPMGPVVILVLEEDVRNMSLRTVAEQFAEFGAPFDIQLDIRPADVVEGGYVAEVVEGETFDEAFETPDASDVASEGERERRIKQVTESADIINIGNNLSLTDDGYPADFGLDIRRIEPAAITSAQVSSKGARYEIQDSSFLEPHIELDETVIGTEDKSSGLVGWAEPHVLAVEKGSMLNELYGTVDTNDEGRVEISIIGANKNNVTPAQVPEPSDDGGSGGSSSSSASGDSIDDRTI